MRTERVKTEELTEPRVQTVTAGHRPVSAAADAAAAAAAASVCVCE